MSYVAVCFAYAAVLLLVSGGLAWATNRRGAINRLFLLLCLLLSVSAIACSLMYVAHTKSACRFWYHLSWLGWCGYPPVAMLIAFTLAGYLRPLQRRWGWVVLFLPAVIFFLRSLYWPFDTDDFTPTAYGTFTPHYMYSIWAVAYYVYERSYILLIIILLWHWGRQSPQQRQKRQAWSIIVSAVLPAVLSLASYLYGPHGEFDGIVALGMSIPAIGICYAIVRYQFAVPLTRLAADHLLVQIQAMVLFITETGTIIKTNTSTETILGFPERELVDRHFTDIFPADTPEHLHWSPAVVPSRAPWSVEGVFVTASGGRIPVQVTCSRLLDEFGDTISLVVIADDLRQTRRLERVISERAIAERALQQANEQLEERIGQRTADLERLNQDYYDELQERRRTEQALRESEERYRTLFENAADAIFITDLALCPIVVNDKACEWLGFTREEFIHLRPTDVIPEEMLANLPAIGMQVDRSGHAVHETVLLRKDGTPLHLEMNSCYIEYEGKTAILTSGRDLTERKRGEERERMLQRLQETTRMRAEFLSYISHELKTPLTPIKGGVDLLMSEDTGPLQATQRTVLEMIGRQAKRLLRLIDDLLDQLCIEQGHLSLHKQPVQITQLVGDSVEAYTGRFRTHGLSLQCITPDEALPLIDGDVQRLGQVFDNLLSNALKYTPHGGVVVQCDRHGDMLRVRFHDTGMGMTADECRRVFEPFYQANTHQPGAGLGLAIVKQLVEAHGGTITVESGGLNQGTCFTILLPALPVEAALDAATV